MSNAPQPKPAPEALKFEFVDLPDVAETFADPVHSLNFDGQNMRIVFCVSRFDEPKSTELPQGKRYPSCRLVLSAHGVLDLINRIPKISAALVRDGVLKAKPTGAAADKTS